MRSTSCEIHFPNNPSGVFHSGQLLSGLVVLKFSKAKTVRGIYVKVIGRAYCRWATGAGRASKTNIGEEFYLDEKSFLVGDDSGSEVTLSPGEINYTFSCMLPVSLPTYVEGELGYNRYKVVVHIDKKAFSLQNQKFKSYFTVIKPFNLNDEVALKHPIVKEYQKVYCICCCFDKQFIDIGAVVPVGGYVPGQTVELSLEINNRTGKNFQNFIVQLMQVIQYHTHPSSTTTTREKTVVKSATCNHGCVRYRSGVYALSLTVPPLPPTDESACNIVKVSYELRILGGIFCSVDEPLLTIPIKIGTFPILQPILTAQQPTLTTRANRRRRPRNSFPIVQNTFAVPCATSVDADSIDPPTYEEAISIYPVDFDGIDAFRPSYPVFRRTPSYAMNPSV